ncbi:MAG TPA: PEP-CTERM sorting domain-containing protein [Methylophilaceae bacterium]|jgi:hypothetical protein
MNFTLKTLVAAAALVAAGSANAALDNGASGNGELFLNVYDTVSFKSYVFDLTAVAGYSQFGTFTLNDFLPATLNNAQGFSNVVAGEAVPNSTNNYAAEASNVALNWSLTSDSAFQAFAAANSNSANWKWNVVALDDSGTSTAKNGRRYLTTVEAGTTSFSQGSGSFSQMPTVGNQLLAVNTASQAADPSVYLSGNDFTSDFGDAWKGALPVNSTNAINTSADFYYLTGRSTTAINEKFENGAKWTFNYVNGQASLAYTTNVVTANVPESDTYAMLLAGLSVMGFVARRRLAA